MALNSDETRTYDIIFHSNDTSSSSLAAAQIVQNANSVTTDRESASPASADIFSRKRAAPPTDTIEPPKKRNGFTKVGAPFRKDSKPSRGGKNLQLMMPVDSNIGGEPGGEIVLMGGGKFEGQKAGAISKKGSKSKGSISPKNAGERSDSTSPKNSENPGSITPKNSGSTGSIQPKKSENLDSISSKNSGNQGPLSPKNSGTSKPNSDSGQKHPRVAQQPPYVQAGTASIPMGEIDGDIVVQKKFKVMNGKIFPAIYEWHVKYTPENVGMGPTKITVNGGGIQIEIDEKIGKTLMRID